MGSKEKAKEFIQASEVNKHYASIIEFSFAYFLQKAEEADSKLAEELKKAKESYNDEFGKAVELAQEAYSEIFTEDELEELIVIHTNPVLKKLRNSTSEIMEKISEKIF